MKRVVILVAILLGLVLMVASVAYAAPPGPGGMQDFCSPWTWAWFKSGNWWYWQFYEWCWNPQQGWYQIWGSWGWS